MTKLLHHLLQNKFTLGWYNAQLVEVLSTFCSKLQQPDLLQDRFDSWVAYMAGVKRGRGSGNLGVQGKKERNAEENNGHRRSFPFSLARSHMPKFPLPLFAPATQANSCVIKCATSHVFVPRLTTSLCPLQEFYPNRASL